MARRHINNGSINPFHITSRTHNKAFFSLPLPEVWKILEDGLFYIHHVYKIRIVSFVLMSNHYHLFAAAPNSNMSEAMQFFNGESAKQINYFSGTMNQVWGNRYHRCEVTSHHYLMNVYKYVYQNPKRANLVTNCEEYPYSTLNGLIGLSTLNIPAEDEILFNGKLMTTLNWLNKDISAEHLSFMKLALGKQKFKLPKLAHKKKNPLELELI